MRHAWRREVRGLVWGCLSYFPRALGVCLLVGNRPTSMEVLHVHNAGVGGVGSKLPPHCTADTSVPIMMVSMAIKLSSSVELLSGNDC